MGDIVRIKLHAFIDKLNRSVWFSYGYQYIGQSINTISIVGLEINGMLGFSPGTGSNNKAETSLGRFSASLYVGITNVMFFSGKSPHQSGF